MVRKKKENRSYLPPYLSPKKKNVAKTDLPKGEEALLPSVHHSGKRREVFLSIPYKREKKNPRYLAFPPHITGWKKM